MKTVHVCGKRGLGDIVASTSYILDNIQEDTHIIFNYPAGHRYKERFNFIMSEFVMPEAIKVTYEVVEGWSTISYSVAVEKFGKESENKDWFFSNKFGYGKYRNFKTQWKENKNGPIALALNYKVLAPYPWPQKWFDDDVNECLLSIVDKKNFFLLGAHYTLEENIEIMSKCRRVVGIDTSWAHISNCMNVPYVLSINKWRRNTVKKFYVEHPNIVFITQEEIFNYLD